MMKKYILVIVALLIVIAAITNPSRQEHQEKVKEKFYDSINKVESKNKDESFEGLLGGMLVNTVVDNMVPQYVRVDNYLLFSITKIKTDTLERRIGVGAFGNVFIKGIDLDEYVKENKNTEVEDYSGSDVKADDYYKNDDAYSVAAIQAATAMSGRDSVTLLYNEALTRLDYITGNNQSLAGALTDNQEAISRVKAQINQIVSNKNASRDELLKAKSLIKNLNGKIGTMEVEIINLTEEE